MTELRAKEEWVMLKDKFPDFEPIGQHGDRWVTNGRLPIIDSGGKCWETYVVEITLLPTFPASLPILVETGKKIERSAEWHVNENGSCCVGTEARQHYLLNGKNTLLNWVQLLAVPYLANHRLRTLSASYANGERSHGVKGIREEYEDIFTNRGDISLQEFMLMTIGNVSLANNSPCFCGSGKKYKRCFLRDPAVHRKGIPTKILIKDLNVLNKSGQFK